MTRCLALNPPRPRPLADPAPLGALGRWGRRLVGVEQGRPSRAELERLVADHHAGLRALLVRLTGSQADADDLLQECFLRARRGMPLGDREAERSWLRRVAVNLTHDLARRSGRARVRDEVAGLERHAQRGTAEPAERALETAELQAAVDAAIAALPERLRTPLVLRTQEGLEYAEIGALIDRKPETARTLVMQARRELERRLASLLDLEAGR